MPIDYRLLELYLKKSDMQAHVLTIYSIIAGMKPEVVVEIGVRYGISTSAILLALSDNGHGKLYSIDVNDSKWARARNHSWGLEGYWEFIQGYSQGMTWGRTVDVLLIDGDHRYDMVREDYNTFVPHVRMGGIIILHDSMPTKDPAIQVDRFLPEIPRDTFELLTLPYSHGLTLLRRIKEDAVTEPDLSPELLQAEAQIEVASTVRRKRRQKYFETQDGD